MALTADGLTTLQELLRQMRAIPQLREQRPGTYVLLEEPRMARLGARYSAAPTAEPQRLDDPDRAAWAALDAGRDPTVDPPVDSSGEPSVDAPATDGRAAAGERPDGGAADRAV